MTDLTLPQMAPPLSEEPLDRLVQIADLHFWHVVKNPLRLMSKRFIGNLNVWLRRRHEFIMDRASEFAEAVAMTGIQTALLTGDFTSTANRREYDMARAFVDGLSRRGLHIELVPGNHDVYTFYATRKKRFESYFRDYLPPDGYPALQWLPGGTPLILVPTVTPNLLSSRGRVTEAEVDAVAALLERCPPVVLVAGHYPILDRTYAYAQEPSHRLRNAQALREVLGASKRRILYICGHTHRFSYVQDGRHMNLAHLSTGAFFRRDKKAGIQGEFAEIHVLRHGFALFRHIHEKSWQRRAMELHQVVRT